MNTTTDSSIISEVLTGNISAYSQLIDTYKDKIFTLAYNIVGNREDAEEIAQDTFVNAFTALSSFKEQSAFSTWLYRIAVNKALNKRKGKKWTIIELKDDPEKEDVYDNLYSSLQQEETGDQKKFIQQALFTLRDEERICITLFYLNDLSVKDIHSLSGISVSNIKILLHRGRKHLYQQLNCLLGKEINNLL